MYPNQSPEQQEEAQEKQLQQVHNPLAVMQPGEQLVCEIKRHPIGIIGMYITAAFIVLVVAILLFVVAPLAMPDVDHAKLTEFAGLGLVVVLAGALFFTYIGHIVYRGNRWIVTTDSLTQIQQVSLFSKQSSQLSMGNLEDVTAEQNGILAHMFNFGIIKAETAGEHSKFKFLYCPNPNYYAQQILNARERFEQSRHGYAAAPAPQPTTPAAPQTPLQ